MEKQHVGKWRIKTKNFTLIYYKNLKIIKYM